MYRSFTMLILAGMLVACGSSNSVVTALQNPASVAEGTVVYLGEELAGQVTRVDFDGDIATVEIELTGEHFSVVDKSAVVVQNTMKTGYPLEIHNSNTMLGPIENGAELRGLDSMLQFGAWSIGDAVGVGPETAANYLSQMQDYLEGQDWELQKQDIREQIRSVGDSAQQAVNEVSKELDETVEKLRDLEDEAVATSEQLGEHLGGDLNEILDQFRESGKALAVELEKLAEQLEENDYGQEAGQGFLDMLQALLEGLNRGSGTEPGGEQALPGDDTVAKQESTIL
jgi:hypothetical protein